MSIILPSVFVLNQINGVISVGSDSWIKTFCVPPPPRVEESKVPLDSYNSKKNKIELLN